MNGPLVVLGDSVLDVDLEGTAARLTPDAPVPVLDDLVEHPRPGGAALAALMAAQDGHEVVLVTAIGADEAGERLAALLDGLAVHRLDYHGPTAVKQRIRAGGQSLLRLDSGSRPGRVHADRAPWAALLETAGAVLVADYGRGVSGVPALRSLLAGLGARVPVVWDPHPRGTVPVPGARLVTPNASEAELFAGRLRPGPERGLASVRARADALVEAWRVQGVAVTLGAGGALLSHGAGVPVVAPAPPAVCVDPCGAGDRFAVSTALALRAGQVTADAVQRGVLDATAYVAAGGPRSLSRQGEEPPAATSGEELARGVAAGGGTVVATGGCFDLLHAGHVATLRAARELGDCLVVCLNSDESVRRLKGPTRPLVPAADRVRVLEALACVDAVVVFDEDTPVDVLRRLRPHVWVKGGDYAGADVPEARALEEWGGQTVALPYLAGHSTTRLVQAAAARHATRITTEEKELSR
jgi:D-beta-D-heptose 7-phosphate kinase / D-beta-D-heptose 1-phosphate adenosyltransferase